jgi:P27 family predicted phage terminase small subunit
VHMSDRALSVWGFVAGLLGPRGVVTVADPLALECMCETYADLVDARNAIRDAGGPTYETRNESGSIIHRALPEVAIVADCDRRLRSWFSAFGLTPADRSKVSAIETPVETKWQKLSSADVPSGMPKPS